MPVFLLSPSPASALLRILSTLAAYMCRLAHFGGPALNSSGREDLRGRLALYESASFPYQLFGGRPHAEDLVGAGSQSTGASFRVGLEGQRQHGNTDRMEVLDEE